MVYSICVDGAWLASLARVEAHLALRLFGQLNYLDFLSKLQEKLCPKIKSLRLLCFGWFGKAALGLLACVARFTRTGYAWFAEDAVSYLACLLTYFLTYLLTYLLTCLPTYLRACLLACLVGWLLGRLVFACFVIFLIACSFARSLAGLLACFFWFALLACLDLLCLIDLRGSRG